MKLRPVFVLTMLVLSACQSYQVTLNDRPIYQPPDLLSGLAMADAALETCVEQTIIDERIVALEKLTRLRCTNAGIQSVTGLEQLAFLRELDVSDNDIRGIDSLFKLGHLALLRLPGNAQLNCEQLSRLGKSKGALKIEAPSQCTNRPAQSQE